MAKFGINFLNLLNNNLLWYKINKAIIINQKINERPNHIQHPRWQKLHCPVCQRWQRLAQPNANSGTFCHLKAKHWVASVEYIKRERVRC